LPDDDIINKRGDQSCASGWSSYYFAINKVDKPNANPEKKEKLAGMNLLVEDWGGKFQLHDISAKWN
jgi:translation initiation factor IF-2